MSFLDEIEAFTNNTLANMTKVKCMSSLDLFSSIIIQTPVDEGVLRNNWYANIGSGSSATTLAASSNAAEVITRVNGVLAGTDPIRDIYFTNNLPYGYVIEFDGHSAQAPSGMVRVNTIRWDNIVRRNAALVAAGVG